MKYGKKGNYFEFTKYFLKEVTFDFLRKIFIKIKCVSFYIEIYMKRRYFGS